MGKSSNAWTGFTYFAVNFRDDEKIFGNFEEGVAGHDLELTSESEDRVRWCREVHDELPSLLKRETEPAVYGRISVL
jgi:hypothetical protein